MMLGLSNEPYHAIISNVKIEEAKTRYGLCTKFTFFILVKQKDRWITVIVNEFDSNNPNSEFQTLVNEICTRFKLDEIDFTDHIGLEIKLKLYFNHSNGVVYPKIKWYEPYENLNEEEK